MSPKISLLCPSYNHEKYVKYFIESVLAQSFKDFELIIVDDCSKDNNIEEILKFKDPRIKLIKNIYNKGLNGTFNVAFENSSGEYCVFIASDDMLKPDYLEFITEFFGKNKDIDVIYSSLEPIDEFNNFKPFEDMSIFKNKEKDKFKVLHNLFTHGNSLFSPGMTMRRCAVETVYPLDVSLLQYQDYIMHIKLLLKHNAHFEENEFVKYRILSTGASKTALALVRSELEEDKLLNCYLEIKDAETLKKIFPETVQFGEPVNETVPYFLGRLALLDNRNSRKKWGYQTIMNFIQKIEGLDLLNKLYDLNFGQFIALAQNLDCPENNSEALRRKKRKYAKLFKLFLILSFAFLLLIPIAFYLGKIVK